MARLMLDQMERSLPDNAPPKLVMSILPKLAVQNETIIALLREQNEILRQQHAARWGSDTADSATGAFENGERSEDG